MSDMPVNCESPLPASSPVSSPLSTSEGGSLPSSPLASRATTGNQSIRPSRIVLEPLPSPAGVTYNNDGYSTDHVFSTSPIRGATGKQRTASARLKAQRRREKEQETVEAAEKARWAQTRQIICDEVLAHLEKNNLTFGDLVHYVSDPASHRGHARWWGFFSVPGRVAEILDYWISSANSDTARAAISGWAFQYVQRVIGHEGHAATVNGFLQTQKMVVDKNFASRFSLTHLYDELRQLCPRMMQLLSTFSTTALQERQMGEKSRRRKNNLVASSALIALGARSQNNSYARHVVGLYSYATGAQRQMIEVLAHLGVCSSYSSLAGTTKLDVDLFQNADSEMATTAAEDGAEPRITAEVDADSEEALWDALGLGERLGNETAENEAGQEGIEHQDNHEQENTSPIVETSTGRPKRVASYGLLKRLSDACRRVAREYARTHMLGFVYDNINMVFKAAEQVLGRKDSQENGTCATAFPLFNAPATDMQTNDLITSFLRAPPLQLADILLSPEEDRVLTDRMQHTVLRIIVTFGGSRFTRFQADILATTPISHEKIPLHRTEILPLPAMHIDESSTTGNADVTEAIFSEMGYDPQTEEFSQTVKIFAGDQLSVARLRSLTQNRVGHDAFRHSFLWAVVMPGLFHYKMAATHGMMDIFYGHSNTARNPGSLAFHNTVLDRKPIVLSSLPPFRVCRDLIFISLYARVFHCLELVSECDSLDDYAENVTFEELQAHAAAIVSQFANVRRVGDLRRSRAREERAHLATHAATDAARDSIADADAQSSRPLSQGDMVFENAVLFMHDALIMRELTDAIKNGDSGRVVLALKLWACHFRGSGRTKYAHEMLFLIHNLKYIWPEPLRRIVLENWLVNPSGKPNSFVEVDLLQEHLNFWIKTVYKAHGSNASWEWLAMISPCIDILRRLATEMNATLGSKQGTKHTTPDLNKDITELMHSLREHRVYQQELGRVIDDGTGKSAIVPNAVSVGIQQLAKPLADFNAALAGLQARCKTAPLIGGLYPGVRQSPSLHLTAAPLVTDSNGPPIERGDDASEALDGSDTGSNVSDDEGDVYDHSESLFSLENAGDVSLDMDEISDGEDNFDGSDL